MTPLVVVQTSLSSFYFPAGFTALSRVFDEKTRSAAVSLITPLAALCGLGAAPAMLGWMAESWGFGVGFSCLGLLLASGVLLVRALPLGAAAPRRCGQPHPEKVTPKTPASTGPTTIAPSRYSSRRCGAS